MSDTTVSPTTTTTQSTSPKTDDSTDPIGDLINTLMGAGNPMSLGSLVKSLFGGGGK